MLQREKNKALKDWAVMESNIQGAKYIVNWLGSDSDIKRAARYNNNNYSDALYVTLMKCVMVKRINWRIRNLDGRPAARYIYNKDMRLGCK